MLPRVALLLPALALCLPLTRLAAQRHSSGFEGASVELAASRVRQPDPLAAERVAIVAAARRSRWLEGGIVGAVAFGVTGGVLAAGFCGADDSAGGASANGCTEEILGGGLLGAAIGGVIGGLVGSQIHGGPRLEP
jgi:hypothetical protein